MTENFSQTNRRRRAGLILAVSGLVLAGCYYGPPPGAMAAPPSGAEYGPSYAQAAPPVSGADYNPGPSYQPYSAPAYAPQGAAGYPSAGGPAYGEPGGYGMHGGGRTVTREQFIERHVQRAQARGKDPETVARRAARRFDKMDTDHNGVLEPAERMAWREAHPGHHGGGMGGGMGGGGQAYQPPGPAAGQYEQ